jgi:hypothetical protein
MALGGKKVMTRGRRSKKKDRQKKSYKSRPGGVSNTGKNCQLFKKVHTLYRLLIKTS